MNLILLGNFNNYFNRKVIRYDDYDKYLSMVTNAEVLQKINFVPNDGINTEQIINWRNEWTPDYLVCLNDKNEIDSRWFVIEAIRTRGNQYKLNLKRDVIADYYNEVLDSPVYVEKGVIDDADNPLLLNREGLNVNQIKTKETLLQDASKCAWLVAYLKKGILGTSQIGEITVNVEGAPGNYKQIATPIENWRFYQYSTLNPTSQPMLVADSFKMVVKGGWLAGSGPSWTYFRTTTKLGESISSETKYDNYTKAEDIPNIVIVNPSPWGFDQAKKLNNKMNTAWNNYVGKDELFNSIRTDFPYVNTQQALKDLQAIVNIGRIRDSQGKYYKVSYSKTTANKNIVVDNTKPTMYNIMKVVTKDGLGYTEANPNKNCFAILPENGEYITVELIEESTVDAKALFPVDSSVVTNNPLYDIICMPYKAGENIHYIKNEATKYVNSDVNLATMYSITTALGGDRGYILDLQLLPYCPIQSAVEDGKVIVDVNADNVFRVEDNAGNFITAGFIAPSGEFTFDVLEPIEFERPHEDLVTRTQIAINGSDEIRVGYHTVYLDLPEAVNTDYTILNVVATSQDRLEQYRVNNYGMDWRGIYVEYEVQRFSMYEGQPSRIVVTLQKEVTRTLYNNTLVSDIKVANECDMYRLVSPNYNGIFEFNLMKNNRRINSFNVDCQYKPFNPYIHVNPDFAGLYGTDFNDSRGLVCGGDFSIGIINDAFQAYEIQNKNYQNIFNRQIENMDVNNSIARQEAQVQAFVGTLQGTATGAAGGAMVGGPWGAVAGAAVGAISSGVAGITDMANLEKRQGEARDFAIDNYQYSLQNIKALPQSISKTSPITPNNKLYPFVEYYTCTDVEKDALRNKLKYDGMSVGIIDTLGNWVSGDATKFVRGQLIRCDNISQDSHLLEELYKEISKGVYL